MSLDDENINSLFCFKHNIVWFPFLQYASMKSKKSKVDNEDWKTNSFLIWKGFPPILDDSMMIPKYLAYSIIWVAPWFSI